MGERVSIGVGVLHRSECPFTRKKPRVELGELVSALNHCIIIIIERRKKTAKEKKINWVSSDGQMWA